VTWWCSAQGVAWTWAWRPYPGVWLFVLAIMAWYAWRRRRWAIPVGAGRTAAFLSGVVVLWLASDWPVGTLGAGYLLSVHTLQYVLYSLAAPPLLLAGVPPRRVLAAAAASPGWRRAFRFAAHPLVALATFNLVLFVSHAPPVVDALRTSQAGSFVMDMAWLVGGLALWWPIFAPVPDVSRLTPPWKLGYLFVSTILPTVPSAFFVFADYPIYGLYELAPRVYDIPARSDQLVAGLTMKIAGDVAAWSAMIVIFFRWVRAEHDVDRRERAARAVAGAEG